MSTLPAETPPQGFLMYWLHLYDTHTRMSLHSKLVQTLRSTPTETQNLPCWPATHESQLQICWRATLAWKWEMQAGIFMKAVWSQAVLKLLHSQLRAQASQMFHLKLINEIVKAKWTLRGPSFNWEAEGTLHLHSPAHMPLVLMVLCKSKSFTVLDNSTNIAVQAAGPGLKFL